MLRSLSRPAFIPVKTSMRHGEGQQRLVLFASLGVSAAAVLLGASYRYYSVKPAETTGRFSVMTWNVLARPFTKYNQKFHRARQNIEEEVQTRTRYTMAGEHIANQSSDLVFLQECEGSFFDSHWNLAADKLLLEYSMFRCTQGDDPGTAVLVKKAGRATSAASSPICIGGSEETGGSSKFATLVPVKAGTKELLAVSVHFTWDGQAPKRQRHAELIGRELEHNKHVRGHSIILGGDFNCEPGERLSELESASFLGGLRRAELPDGRATGLSGDFSQTVCIDHFYTSRDLGEPAAQVSAWPASPWGGKVTRPAKVSAASDHLPVTIELDALG